MAAPAPSPPPLLRPFEGYRRRVWEALRDTDEELAAHDRAVQHALGGAHGLVSGEDAHAAHRFLRGAQGSWRPEARNRGGRGAAARRQTRAALACTVRVLTRRQSHPVGMLPSPDPGPPIPPPRSDPADAEEAARRRVALVRA